MVHDNFTIGYRCTGFRFDLAGLLNKPSTSVETRGGFGDTTHVASKSVSRAGVVPMPFKRRLKSIGQATVILLALGPFLPLTFFSEICEAAIERLSKTRFGKTCINASERLALFALGGRNCCSRLAVIGGARVHVENKQTEPSGLLALGFFALVLLFLWPTL